MMSRHDQTASMNYGGGRDLIEMFGYERAPGAADTVTAALYQRQAILCYCITRSAYLLQSTYN